MKQYLIYVVCVALSYTGLYGAVIVSYTFDGSTGDEEVFAPTSVKQGVVASDMSRGSGVSLRTGSDAFAGGTWSANLSPDENDYFSFTLTPQNGNTMTLTQFDFDERRSGTGPTMWTLRSSVDSFENSIFTFGIPDTTDTRSHSIVLDNSLSGLASATEFRLYGYGAESSSGTWRIDTVAVTGAVVPEPWHYGFVGAFVCVVVLLQRHMYGTVRSK